MPKPDIHQLEERVLALMGEFRRLKEKNQGLSCQIDQLSREKKAMAKEKNLNQGKQDRLSQLGTLNRNNEKDRKARRTRVQSLLKNLEKFDLA